MGAYSILQAYEFLQVPNAIRDARPHGASPQFAMKDARASCRPVLDARAHMHAARYNRQMATQNYSNHVRLVPGFHFVLAGILFLTLIGSLVNLYKSWGIHCQFYSAALIVVLVVCCGFLFNYTRVFPLKAQDRAIRAEENLRHFVLTGKLLDARLAVGQIVALRFAPDNEFVDLARKAADGNMPPADIKRAIKNWKADTYRA